MDTWKLSPPYLISFLPAQTARFQLLPEISTALDSGTRAASSGHAGCIVWVRGKKNSKLLRRIFMRKFLSCLSSVLFAAAPFFAEVASASDQTKDDDRLKNCGTVLKEILDVPDDIPQDLLDKADCVVVFPSVLKAAFIVGASYGRGAMSCRKGENFGGPSGAPTMRALEGGGLGVRIAVEPTHFVCRSVNKRASHGILPTPSTHCRCLPPR